MLSSRNSAHALLASMVGGVVELEDDLVSPVSVDGLQLQADTEKEVEEGAGVVAPVAHAEARPVLAGDSSNNIEVA